MRKLLIIFTLTASAAFAQSIIGKTTLSATINSFATTMCVASATGIVVPNLAANTLGSWFVIDNEVMQVTGAGPTSTCFRVKRGLIANSVSNAAAPHTNGQNVYVLGQNLSTGDTSRPVSTTAFLTQRAYQPFYVAATPTLFGVSTTSVTDVNGKLFISAMEVDANMISIGACWLNGATVTTDKHLAAIWDSTGLLLATSALGGVADAGNASIYQCSNWVTPIALVGPAMYFVGVQGNGTTDNVQMYNTGAAHTSFPTTSLTGTFGTVPNLTTIPTTFTAAVGPLMVLTQ